jgi:hypothetical protein
MKFYLAGPMTGIPQFNFPAFHEAAAKLRAAGYVIQSPAEMDDPKTTAAAMASPDGKPGSGSPNGDTWGDFLARDVKIIADGVHGIILMPGWEKSRGARLELFVSMLCGHWVYRYYPEAPILRSISTAQIRAGLLP